MMPKYPLLLKMEKVSPSETLVTTYNYTIP
jgi:hypothetical protein